MSGIAKVLTGILAVMAVVACLATISIIGYAMLGVGDDGNMEVSQNTDEPAEEVPVATQAPTPEATPTNVPEATALPDVENLLLSTGRTVDLANHVHDYKESVEKKATCYSAGKLKYTCEECGDSYYVDVMSIGHVADDWEVVRKPTADQDGLRVQKCIYCDEIMAQETVPFEDENGEKKEEPAHIHQYTATTEREPSCILAGLRKYSCSCGDFYTEMIPAPGHVATDWEVAEEATEKYMGTEQRTCTVCGVVLDSRPINKLTPSPSASASPASTSTPNNQSSASPASSAATPSASPSATPSPTPHEHDYRSYVLKEANCTETGIRSFICNCGSSMAEVIERDLNNHTFRAVVIPATENTQGYTAYTCIRCNYSYFDNYTPAIRN
ncbi:hypothetical protein [Parablautia muri]|uniref:Uncharacterized protein n=1 Tax=Parablautia muri TaxID=2320879 RepID=A0A9X5BI35_9FIRM|nr:hypothetical protein [Parablautia muri]NBJ94079.1 hypothetical protein [Parablautia muri]